jgi:GAF domain-containing protein
MARQMSTALSNQLLLSETQDRAAQLEKITEVETALSQADDENGIIKALALMPDVSEMISLHYIIEEENPTNAFTVAHWENGKIKQKDSYLNSPIDLDLQPGFSIAHQHPDRITYVSDIKSDARISKEAAKEATKLGFRSVMVIPLRSAGRWQGFVSIKWKKIHNFTVVDASTWEQLREPLAAVVASRRAYERAEQQAQEARNRSNELVILNEMGRSLTALVDMDTILENIYRYTARLMDAGNFYVAFYDMKRDEITFALDIRGDRVMRNVGTRKAGKGLTEHIIRSKEPMLIPENVDDKLDELGIEKIGPTSVSWLGVPLMVGSQVIGVIALQHWERPRAYNDQHLRLMTSVAGQAAIAIENAHLFEQIQARARRERILREVTAKVRGASDADSVMRTAVQEIGKALGRRTFVYLNQNQQYETELSKEEAYGD